jgi:hypothetical protein
MQNSTAVAVLRQKLVAIQGGNAMRITIAFSGSIDSINLFRSSSHVGVWPRRISGGLPKIFNVLSSHFSTVA